MHGGKHVGDGGAMLHMNIDRWVADLVDKVGLPVILHPWWDHRIEHTLQDRMWQWAYHIEGRRQKGPDRFEGVLCTFHRPRIAPHDAAHRAIVKMLREGRSGRHDKKSKEPIDVV